MRDEQRGGVVQGIGAMLYEACVFYEDGSSKFAADWHLLQKAAPSKSHNGQALVPVVHSDALTTIGRRSRSLVWCTSYGALGKNARSGDWPVD